MSEGQGCAPTQGVAFNCLFVCAVQCALQFLHCSVQWYSRSALFAVQLLQCSVFQHAGLYTFANGFLALSYIDLEQLFWPYGMGGVKISKN